MNDQQFKQFMHGLDSILDQKFSIFREEMRSEMREELADIRSNIDWLVGEVSDIKSELVVINSATERDFDDHEKRISKLELAAAK
jgi:hypothetical protein